MATKIEEMIKNSTCFGIAYDGAVKECRICEVKTKCKAKCECGTGSATPPKKPEQAPLADKDEVSENDEAAVKSLKKEASGTAKKPDKPVKKEKDDSKPAKPAKEKKEKKEVQYAADMPDFKNMSIEDIESLLEEKGANMEDFEKYKEPKIRKMRLTMAIKKYYTV